MSDSMQKLKHVTVSQRSREEEGWRALGTQSRLTIVKTAQISPALSTIATQAIAVPTAGTHPHNNHVLKQVALQRKLTQPAE
jgi:hypothetical protein